MPRIPRSHVAFAAALGLLLAKCGVAQAGAKAPDLPPPSAVAFFETKVRPLLAENCYKCHGAKKQRGGLRLDSRAAILQGGESGPVVVPGHPEKSLLLKAVRHEDPELKMPPTQKLSKQQIDSLARWVKSGAAWPG